MQVPIVYTIRGCDACVKLLRKWEAEGVAYEERRVELSQECWTKPALTATWFPSWFGRMEGWSKDLKVILAASFKRLFAACAAD